MNLKYYIQVKELRKKQQDLICEIKKTEESLQICKQNMDCAYYNDQELYMYQIMFLEKKYKKLVDDLKEIQKSEINTR